MGIQVNAGFWDLDLQSRELLLCPRSRQMLGIQGNLPRKLGQQDWLPRIHPDDLPVIEDELDAAGRRNEVYAARFRAVRPDGSLFHILGVGRTVAKDAQRIVGLNFDLAATAAAAEMEARRPFGALARLASLVSIRSRPANENERLRWRSRRSKSYLSPKSGQGNTGCKRERLVEQALATMERRKLRHSFLNPAMLGEPAFDMLLALYVTSASPAILSLRILAPSVGISEAAAARWLQLLIDDGLVLCVRLQDPGGIHAALTEKGRSALDGYFEAIRRPGR